MKTYASPAKRIFSSFVAFVMAFSIVVFAPPFQEVVMANEPTWSVVRGPSSDITVLDSPEWVVRITATDLDFTLTPGIISAWENGYSGVTGFPALSDLFLAVQTHAVFGVMDTVDVPNSGTNATRRFSDLGLRAVLTDHDTRNGETGLEFQITSEPGVEPLRAVNPTMIRFVIPNYLTDNGDIFLDSELIANRFVIKPVIQLWSDARTVLAQPGVRLENMPGNSRRLTISGEVGSELFGGTGNPGDPTYRHEPVFWIHLVGDVFDFDPREAISLMDFPPGVTVQSVQPFRYPGQENPLSNPMVIQQDHLANFIRVTLVGPPTSFFEGPIEVTLPTSGPGSPWNFFHPDREQQVTFANANIARWDIGGDVPNGLPFLSHPDGNLLIDIAAGEEPVPSNNEWVVTVNLGRYRTTAAWPIVGGTNIASWLELPPGFTATAHLPGVFGADIPVNEESFEITIRHAAPIDLDFLMDQELILTIPSSINHRLLQIPGTGIVMEPVEIRFREPYEGRLTIYDPDYVPMQVIIETDGAIATMTPEGAETFFWMLIRADGSEIVWADPTSNNRIDFSDPELGIEPGVYFLTGGLIYNGETMWYYGEWHVIEVPRDGEPVRVNVEGTHITITPAGAERYYWILIDPSGTEIVRTGPSYGNTFNLPVDGLDPGTYFLTAAVVNNGYPEWLVGWVPVVVEEAPGNEPVVEVAVSGANITITPNDAAPFYWALISPDGNTQLASGSSQHNVINLANYTSGIAPGDYFLTVVATVNGTQEWLDYWAVVRLTGSGSAMLLELIEDIEIYVNELEVYENEPVAEEYTIEEEAITEDYTAEEENIVAEEYAA